MDSEGVSSGSLGSSDPTVNSSPMPLGVAAVL
jgi:hypothetical protein